MSSERNKRRPNRAGHHMDAMGGANPSHIDESTVNKGFRANRDAWRAAEMDQEAREWREDDEVAIDFNGGRQ